MRYLILLVALVSVGCGGDKNPVGPTQGRSDSLSGTWVSFQYNETTTLTLIQTGQSLSGSWSSNGAGFQIGGSAQGTVQANAVTVNMAATTLSCSITYTATRETTDRLVGTMSGCGLGSGYTLNRQ